MEINEIKLENWMPYYGKQSIQLSHGKDRNVNIVLARNGKGKTSVMYAVFWCLYGKVMDNRTREQLAESEYLNFRALDEGDLRCSVQIIFMHKGIEYEFTRAADYSGGDAKTTFSARRDRASISNTDAQSEILRIVPERMARFWLLDAKLLDEYFQLLASKSHGQVKEFERDIKKALGFEVFQTAENLFGQYHGKLNSMVKNDAAQDKRKVKLVDEHNIVTTKIKNADEEIKNLEKIIEDNQVIVDQVSNAIKDVQELAEASASIKANKIKIDECDNKIEVLEGELRKLNDGLWSCIFVEESRDLQSKTQNRINQIMMEQNNFRDIEAKVEVIRNSLNNECCEICNSPVSQSASDFLNRKLTELESKINVQDQEDEKHFLRNTLNILKEAEKDADMKVKQKVIDISNDIGKIHTDRVGYETLYNEAKDKRKNYNTNDLSLDQEIKKLKTAENMIERSQTGIKDQNEIIEKANDRIKEIEDTDLWKATIESSGNKKKLDQLNALISIFKSANNAYVKEFGEGIEDTANEIFTEMYTAETAKKKINLNRRFGLDLYIGNKKMRYSTGMAVMSLLTFSLALNRYQEFERPMITDEILSDLDDEHKSSTIKSLANLSSQVLIFAHSGTQIENIKELLQDRLGYYYTIDNIDEHYNSIKKEQI